MCSGGEPHVRNRDPHQFSLLLAKHAKLTKLPTAHMGIGKRGRILKSFGLLFPSGLNLGSDVRTARSRRAACQLVEWYCWHFDVNVDAIQKWATNATHVTFDLRRRAIAGTTGIGSIAAWARV